MAARYRSRAWLGGAALSALTALWLAACGGSSTPAPPVSAAGTAGAQGSAGSTPAATAGSGAGRDTVSRADAVQRPLRGTGGAEVNDENARSASGDRGTSAGAVPDPCKLVSQAQAQAIVGAPIAAPQTAPLGPTCIYEPRSGREQITVTVEALDLAKIKAEIHGLTRTAMASHTAYCGRYGRTTTFVPLAHGQVLNIAAPCAIGIRFAEEALRRLGNSS